MTPRRGPGAAAPGGRLAGLRLLLVDDNPVNREIACHLLRLEGAACKCVGDAAAALALLRAAPGRFDLVFMDVEMPALDGLEATRRIRAELRLPALPVIALTAGVLPHQRAQALAAGMNDFIGKPFGAGTLGDTVLRWTRAAPAPAAAARLPGATAGRRAGDGFPAVAGIDGRRASRHLQGQRALFLDTLRALRDDFGDAPARIRADLARADRAGALHRLHRLRGVAGPLAADTVVLRAVHLEEALRAGQPAAAMELQVQALAAALQEVIAGLPAEARQPRSAPAPAPDPGRPPDPAALARLAAALEQGDTVAFELHEALYPFLAARHGAAALEPLQAALDQLRFAQALALLRRWYPEL